MNTLVRFTVAEFDRMVEQGVFDDRHDVRIELIRGEIREMPAPNPDHEDTVDILNRWSVENTPSSRVTVRIQNSIGISELDSVPVPDVAWMRARNYRKRRPEPADVLLLIEVAESSLANDRGEKASLYAEAGVAEYWIVNLRDETIEIHRKPKGDRYREITTVGVGQSISPVAFPSLKLDVGRAFRK